MAAEAKWKYGLIRSEESTGEPESPEDDGVGRSGPVWTLGGTGGGSAHASDSRERRHARNWDCRYSGAPSSFQQSLLTNVIPDPAQGSGPCTAFPVRLAAGAGLIEGE